MRTYELLSIVGTIAAVGVALGAVVVGSNTNLHAELRAEMQELRTGLQGEIRELRTEVQGEIRELRTEVRTEIRSLETRLAAVERRQARTEGLLEGLRDTIAGQRPGESPSPREEG